MELLVAGLPTIDLDDWENNTNYVGYNASSDQIIWFWKIIYKLREEERALLLKFVCGTSSIPSVRNFLEFSVFFTI